MKVSKDISDELKSIAPLLAGLDRREFYAVPEGYFAESSVKLTDVYAAHLADMAPVLASIGKTEMYTVPHGYFISLSDQVMIQIHAEEVVDELAYAAPHLAALDKKTAFGDVPANYFAVFPMIAVKRAMKEESQSTSVGQGISRWSIWLEQTYEVITRPKYSFAMACMFAIAVVMGVVVSHSTLTAEEKIFAQMQQIPMGELQGYMGKHRDDFDEHTILHHINEIEFTHYLDGMDGPGGNKAADNTAEDIID